MTKDEALELIATKWWEGRTDEEIARRQLSEPRLICPLDVYRPALNRALGRDVFCHEAYGNMDGLLAELDGNISPPENPMDSLAATLLEHGRDPDEVIVPVVR